MPLFGSSLIGLLLFIDVLIKDNWRFQSALTLVCSLPWVPEPEAAQFAAEVADVRLKATSNVIHHVSPEFNKAGWWTGGKQ